MARRSAAASLEAVSSTYSSFPAAPLLASSDGICPSLTRAVQQAVNQPPAGDEVPSRWLDVRDRTRAATHARVERCRVLVEEAKAARIPASARRRAGHRVKHRPLPDQQHRASSPRGRAGAPLRAARFLFRCRDAPAGMTSSSGRAAGLILRALTVSAWTPHPPHAAARLSAAASLEARFPQHTPPSRWRRGALACFLPSGIV